MKTRMTITGLLVSIFLIRPSAQPAFPVPAMNDNAGFESDEGDWERGGRISPNELDLDLEYWWQNNKEGVTHEEPLIMLGLEGTPFEDPECTRTWILNKGGWIKPGSNSEETDAGARVIALQALEGNMILALAIHNASRVISKKGENRIGIALEPVSFSLAGRYHVRGKLFLMPADLDIVADRVRKEMNF